MARLARSLETLRAQVNLQWPKRSKSHDGWIGDAAHAATKSDHNPNAAGVVTAIDITHDPAHGLDARKLAEALVSSRDPRIKYIISNAQINSSKVSPWQWRPYTGANAHRAHVHVSVMAQPALYDDAKLWGLGYVAPPPKPPLPRPDIRRRMAKAIIDFEARRDSEGRLSVYLLPGDDGGGTYEVAGINNKFHPAQAAKLKALIGAGKYQEAEDSVADYIVSYTDVVSTWGLTLDPGVEFFLRDCVFNRGPTGAAKILQRALAVPDDGEIGQVTRNAYAMLAPPIILSRLRTAREEYEREVVGYRANFWNGLVNRWNKVLATAKTFSGEVPATPPISPPIKPPISPPTKPSMPKDIAVSVGVGGLIGAVVQRLADNPIITFAVVAIMAGFAVWIIKRRQS